MRRHLDSANCVVVRGTGAGRKVSRTVRGLRACCESADLMTGGLRGDTSMTTANMFAVRPGRATAPVSVAPTHTSADPSSRSCVPCAATFAGLRASLTTPRQAGAWPGKGNDDGVLQVHRPGRRVSSRAGHRGRAGRNAVAGVCRAVHLRLVRALRIDRAVV